MGFFGMSKDQEMQLDTCHTSIIHMLLYSADKTPNSFTCVCTSLYIKKNSSRNLVTFCV